MNRRKRVVVVGAGMGGLVTALELACQGLDVTVLEKECQAGGKLSQLEVAGQRLDCGPTVLTMPWVFDDIFKRAGAGFRERVALTPLERLASHAWSDGSQLDLFSDTEQSAAAIRAFAGEREANGYRRFAQRAQKVFELLDQPFMRRSCSGPMQLMRAVGLRRMPELWQIAPFKTLHSVLKEYFDDARLLQLFGRYATYCGSSPYACPATLMLVTHVERCGVWSVAGGMVQLAQALTSLCMERGVTFNYHAEVASVLVEKRRISGLQLTDGTSVRADVIVMNADAAALPQGCFGEQARAASISMSRSQRSLSALTWSMVTAPSGRPLARHNVFFSDDYRAEFEDLFRHRRLPQQPTVYVCAQDQDAATTSPHANQRLFCLVNAPADGDLKPLQQEEIDLCQQRMLLLLKQCGVMVDLAPHSMTITTPSHFSQRYPASGGALYGPASHGWTASFRRARARTSIEGLYLAGGQHPSGAGPADGSTIGHHRSTGSTFRPRFERQIPADGYAWWYLDAVSDDGQHAITLIAFIGSVFSPYYAHQRRHGPAAPENHCAMNVALYGAKRRWAMTERGSHALSRDANLLQIGPSSIRWDGKAFRIKLDEVTAPLPSRIRGSITLTPEVQNLKSFALSHTTEHRWWPMVPRARIDVDLALPGVRWSGNAYLDCNWGAGPLEQCFRRWSWSRSQCSDGSSEIFYDVESRDRHDVNLALRVTADGALEEITAPAAMQLSKTRWRINRLHRCEASDDKRRITALEDGPFYARTLIEATAFARSSKTMHESLCLERFSSPVVQAMLPFRMPRRPVLADRAVVLLTSVHHWWRATVAPNRRVGPDDFHHDEKNADAKNRQHLDQPKVVSHGDAPWYRVDRHLEDLIELFLRLEQRDAAARRGTSMRSRV